MGETSGAIAIIKRIVFISEATFYGNGKEIQRFFSSVLIFVSYFQCFFCLLAIFLLERKPQWSH